MKSPPLFNSRALAWLIGLGVVSFLLVIGLSVFMKDPKYMGTYGADSFSTSAIGHKAFYRSLKNAGFNVLQSQNRTSEKVTTESLLLVMEPGVDPERLEDLKAMFVTGNVLLVLPKRNGLPGGLNRRWVAVTSPVGDQRIEQILGAIGDGNFKNDPGASIISEGKNQNWTNFSTPYLPTIDQPQTINWSRLTPLIWNDEGILLGKLNRSYGNFYILSDPDILQNHGLGKGDNAVFLFDIIAELTQGTNVIIVDETAHGHILSPDILKSAFSPPLLFPVMIFLAAFITLIWGTAARFAPTRDERPAFTKDKLPLIQNISSLLTFGGHFGTVTERYYMDALKDVAEKLYAPNGLHGMDLINWVDNNSAGREISVNYKNIRRRAYQSITHDSANSARQVKLAKDVYNWKNEVLYGTGKNKQTK